MAVLIATSKQKKVFDKAVITIGSAANCDMVVNIGSQPLVLQYSQTHKKYLLVNKGRNPDVLFKGAPIRDALAVETAIKLSIANSEDYIVIKLVDLPQSKAPVSSAQPKVQTAPAQNLQTVVQTINQTQSSEEALKLNEIQQQKAMLEKSRSPIIKQVGFAINDIKNRLSLNNKASVFCHIALFCSSVITAFGVSNFVTGLKIEETGNFLNLPMNIKILILFALVVYGISLVLKQGVFLFFQNKRYGNTAEVMAEKFQIASSVFIFIAIYAINLIYYMNINPVFAIAIALFFVALTVVLATACGYFKFLGHALSYELDKYEYREDFEAVMNNYRVWIDRYINTFSRQKIENIKDKMFNLQLKSWGEIVLGLITAPFLAYGVSNTLASCFPEAAGWIRLSGLRFSPVFLVLASFLIIFAFFSFVNAFYSIRKIQASNVIKHDGFTDFMTHGVSVLGIQGVRKLESEKLRSLIIGCSIIFIEFTMNTSYFFTEIGGDLQGILLSIIAALVPTALLIAETYMLSQTKFDINACEELMAKRDV